MSQQRNLQGPGARHAEATDPKGEWGLFARGALEALCVPALFVAFGLGSVAWLQAAPSHSAGYAETLVEDRAERPRVWLIDGFNVVQRSLLGGREREAWWTAPRREELLARSASFDDASAEIWVVFDGPAPSQALDSQTRPRQIFAHSADEWVLERVRGAENPKQIAVVTDDRRLASRVRRRGAQVVATIEFLRRCSG